MKTSYLRFLFAFILLSCSRTAEQEQEIFHIDLNKNYPEFSLSLSDIADIRFIKLGGEEQGVFYDEPSHLIYFDELNHKIFAGPGYGPVMMFEEDGTFIRKFGNYGRGPGEYLLWEFFVRPEKQIIGIASRHERKVMLFDYDGNLIPDSERTVAYRLNTSGLRLFHDAVFTFDPGSRIRFESAAGNKDQMSSEKTLRKIDPETFEEDTFFSDICYASPLVVPLSWETHPEYRWIRGVLIEGASGLLASTFRSDTTYLIDHDLQIRPFLVNTSHNSGDHLVYPTVETHKYLLCHAKVYGESSYYVIEKSSKKIFKVTDDTELPQCIKRKVRFSDFSLSLNPLYCIYPYHASSLKKYYDLLPEELKTIVDQCDDESNPILMVIKFKE